MEKSSQEIIFFIAVITFVILLFVLALFSLLLISRNRRLKFKNDTIKITAEFQKTIDTTKHEVMEQVFSDVSGELHDNVGQTLTLAVLNINRMKDDESGLVNETREIIRQAMQEIREVSHMLSSDYWNKFDLRESIQTLEMQLIRLKSIRTDFTFVAEFPNLGKEQEIIIFRVIQELINNTLKHSKANMIRLNIDYKEDCLIINYHDNGIGISNTSVSSNGIGMSSIKSRMNLVNAKWDIKSNKENGFQFLATIPINTITK